MVCIFIFHCVTVQAENSQLDRGTLLRLSLWATRGARNPNLQVLLRMRRMHVASIRLDFH